MLYAQTDQHTAVNVQHLDNYLSPYLKLVQIGINWSTFKTAPLHNKESTWGLR